MKIVKKKKKKKSLQLTYSLSTILRPKIKENFIIFLG